MKTHLAANETEPVFPGFPHESASSPRCSRPTDPEPSQTDHFSITADTKSDDSIQFFFFFLVSLVHGADV